MNNDVLIEKLTAVLQDVFDDESIVAAPELTADDVDGWDSLSHIRLMLTIERTFGIKFAASEVTSLKNVGDLISIIEKKLT